MPIGDRSLTRVVKLKDLLNKSLQDIKSFKFLAVKTQQEIADIACDTIRDRTRRGFGVDKSGRSVRFKGYSTGAQGSVNYKRIRREQGLSDAPPDLTVSGSLLDGLHADQLRNDGNFRIALRDGDLGKSRGAHEGVRRKDIGKVRRPFLGFTQADKDRIKRQVSGMVKKEYLEYMKKKLKTG